MTEKIFLLTVEDIKNDTCMHTNVDERLVAPQILYAQDMKIEPLLGTSFYQRLVEGKKSGNLTADETVFVDNYLRKCLVYYTLAELPLNLSVQFYNAGALRTSGSNGAPSDLKDLYAVSNHFENKAKNYGDRMVNYLKEAASPLKFPEYYSPSSGLDKLNPSDSAFKAGIIFG
jgi:hypothetical protein